MLCLTSCVLDLLLIIHMSRIALILTDHSIHSHSIINRKHLFKFIFYIFLVFLFIIDINISWLVTFFFLSKVAIFFDDNIEFRFYWSIILIERPILMRIKKLLSINRCPLIRYDFSKILFQLFFTVLIISIILMFCDYSLL